MRLKRVRHHVPCRFLLSFRGFIRNWKADVGHPGQLAKVALVQFPVDCDPFRQDVRAVGFRHDRIIGQSGARVLLGGRFYGLGHSDIGPIAQDRLAHDDYLIPIGEPREDLHAVFLGEP